MSFTKFKRSRRKKIEYINEALKDATVQCICNDKKYGKNPISIKYKDQCNHKAEQTVTSKQIALRLSSYLHSLLIGGYLRKGTGIELLKAPVAVQKHLIRQIEKYQIANKRASGWYFEANLINTFHVWKTSQIYPRK